MKRGIKILIALNAVVILILVGMLFMAETYPFSPGDPLFALQSTAESSRISLAKDPVKRVEMSFELVERRLADLAMVSDLERIHPTVNAFDLVLTQAIQSIQSVSEEEALVYYDDVQTILEQTEIVLASLEERIDHQHLVALHEKIDSLQAATSPVEIQQVVKIPSIPSVIIPKAIPFLDKEVEHNEFPLTDAHENLECESCHASGVYVDTPTECSSCHNRQQVLATLLESGDYSIKRSEKQYINHFSGDCADCHIAVTWEPEEFNHEGVYECKSCHYDSYPQEEQVALGPFSFISLGKKKVNTMIPPHYQGDCIDCHTNTEDWADYEYAHDFSNCISCHEDQRELLSMQSWMSGCASDQTCQTCHSYSQHKDKYGEECANCHQSTEKWLPAEVDHSAYPNCLTCHYKDRPDDKHYTRNCSVCHYATDWKKQALDHTMSADCRSCHQAPVAHTPDKYSGQCSNCHNTTVWTSSVFNHALSDCTNCHKTPVNHYPASCTSCHVTNSWLKVSVNHTGMTVCTDCHGTPSNHYPGVCKNCHNTNTWAPTVDIHKYTTATCSSCHFTPIGHYPGSCETCHQNTSSWSASYNHTLNYTCSTCHPKPVGHWTGECSNCHFTDSWSHVVFDHTGFTLCNSCHIRPAGHPRGQCSNCHNTTTWYVPPTPTPLPTNTPQPTLTPTATLVPTNTPLPTWTPTQTPEPTEEPTEDPTPEPDPTEEPTEEPTQETGGDTG